MIARVSLASLLALSACRREPPRRPPPPLFPYRGQGCAFDVTRPVVGDRADPHGEVGASSRRPRDVHLALRDDGRSLVARWSTEPAVMASEIRLQPQAGGPERVERGWSSLDPARRDLRWHEAVVCGLSPATRYVYTVGGGASRSNPASFTTAPTLGVPVVLAVATEPAVVASARDIARARPDALVVPWGDGLPPRAALDQASALLAATPLVTRGQLARYGAVSFGGEGAWVMHDVDVVSRRVDGGSERRALSAPSGWGTLTAHPNRAAWAPSGALAQGWDWDLNAPAARGAAPTGRPGS